MKIFQILMLASGLLTVLSASGDYSSEEWGQRIAAEPSIDKLGRLYIELLLEEDPTLASQFGIHGKSGDETYFDRRMPDASSDFAQSMSDARALLVDRLESIDERSLDRPDQIDLHILTQRVKLDQFTRNQLDGLNNPLGWVTQLGTAASGLVSRDYAPLDQRLQSFSSRCRLTGAFLQQLRTRLSKDSVQPSEMQKVVSLQRLRAMTGKTALYGKTLPELLVQSSIIESEREVIRGHCANAVDQINEFANWVEQEMLPRPNGNWRLGAALYDEKYRLQMDYPLGPEQLASLAEEWLTEKSAQLVRVGREIHDTYLKQEITAGETQLQAETTDAEVVRNIFSKLSEDRSTPESLIADSYAMADSIIRFVNEHDLMDLPATSKLRIEPIPAHLAGNTVAQIDTAPPFEPHLPSVWYWDLQFLAASDDFLKEYNRPALAVVYIHEGVPGHFVQLDYSNRSARVIPKVFWNGPMVEGWATYIVTQLIDQGFTVYPDDPLGHSLQQMVDDKMVLRSIMNALIDIRLHRTDWPEEEAVKLMVEKGFQEISEAEGKLVRAKLSSVQLTTYFAGHAAIEDILREYRQQKGADFRWKAFNERLVGAGSPPFFAIREFMLQDESEQSAE